MVAQHKIPVLRHLIGEPDVTFAQCQLVHIRLVQHSAVHGHMAVLVHGDHVTGLADHTLEQELVLPIKAAQVAGFHAVGLDQQQNVLIFQRGVHAVAGHLQHRQEQGGQQHGHSGHHHQRINGAAQYPSVPAEVGQTVALGLYLLCGGDGRKFDLG